LLKDIEDALQQTGLPAQALELEITENIALNYEDAITPLQKLADRGVKLAFDDFGTGYASLSYLTRFPLSRIKIDRSFVRNITDNTEHAAIVRSLIAMAHNLSLEVIAEGGRDGSASGIPARAGVRGSARLSLRRAAAGRRVRGLSAGRTARIPSRGRGQATARRRGSLAGRRGTVP
jgi:predicted signal transduction protein with EAL and GGDEF domain